MSNLAIMDEKIKDQPNAQQSVGFGIMSVAGWKRPVDYELYEVAHHNIGIISNNPLEIGTVVTIDYRDSQVMQLIVYQIINSSNLPEGYKRFRLICTTFDKDFEQLLPESSLRKTSLSEINQYHIRFGRFETEIPTRIEARTFGSVEPYIMKTINVSKSGFLLSSPTGFRVPFHESTLLELTIHLEKNLELHCVGKVMRYEVDFEKRVKRYGIAIVEMNAQDRDIYFSFIDDTEHRKNRQVYRLLKLTMPI